MKPTDKTYRNRVNLVIGFFMLWCIAILGKLVSLQILQKQSMSTQTAELHSATEKIPALRGEILDAKGRTLAISQREPYVFLDPVHIKDVAATVRALKKALSAEAPWKKKFARDKNWEKKQVRKIKKLAQARRRYYKVASRLSESACESLRQSGLPGIYLRNEVWRIYPNRWTGSHMIGFINRAGAAEGLEQVYHQAMAGKPGLMEMIKDGRGKKIGLRDGVIKEPVEGADLHLTVDSNIQLFAEDSLRLAMKRYGPKNITVIVMEPQTGAILAMANMPDFNPNLFRHTNYEERRNRAVTDTYDPGSAFKIITVAAAVDAGAIGIDNHFFSAEGPVKVFGSSIRNYKPFGWLSVSEILWHSSNAGAIQISLKMEPEVFADYIQRFGFGERTGIDLPAESPGILNPLSQWKKGSRYYLAIGHEISVTPLQMLRSANVIANGGRLVTPHVARKLVHADGSEVDLRPAEPAPQVISPKAAAQVAQALLGVVESGTAGPAALPGVRVFGKTGTAQRIIEKGYAKDKFNSSFVGFFPAEKPRYGMIVVVHDPRGANVHGGEVAAPIFSEIGRRILQYDQSVLPVEKWVVTPEMPRWGDGSAPIYESENQMPDFLGLGLRNLLYKSRQKRITLKIEGKGTVVQQLPKPGVPIPKNRICKVLLKEG